MFEDVGKACSAKGMRLLPLFVGHGMLADINAIDGTVSYEVDET